MGKSLKKNDITFALKVSILFSLILIASYLKEKKADSSDNMFVKNISIDVPGITFTNF